jgi:hypothetical protein
MQPADMTQSMFAAVAVKRRAICIRGNSWHGGELVTIWHVQGDCSADEESDDLDRIAYGF